MKTVNKRIKKRKIFSDKNMKPVNIIDILSRL